MRYLILSDLHSNWEALNAVLQDCQGQYDRIVCCGDLAGYGPDPNAVLNWARQSLHAVIRGNHDRACSGMDNLEWFNPVAKEASYWTMDQLTEANCEYLQNLPPGPLPVDSFVLAHGSPLDEDEYLVSAQDAAGQFPYVDYSITFFGHTHLQGGFAWRKGHIESYAQPCFQLDEKLLILDPDAAYLLNPGSVGQPRDSDARAAYLLYDEENRLVTFRRVHYNDHLTRRKIIAAGLPDALGDRLLVGR